MSSQPVNKIKTPCIRKVLMLGATEQNLLKLFEWIIESPETTIDLRLVAPSNSQRNIIYLVSKKPRIIDARLPA